MKRFGMEWDPPSDPIDPTRIDVQVTHYEVEIANNPSFSPLYKWDRHVIATTKSFKVDNAKVNGVRPRYYGRVRSIDEEGNASDWIYNTTTQVAPTSTTQGEEPESLDIDDLNPDIVTFEHIRVDAIRAKHKIVGAAFMTNDDPNAARIVIKDVAGANDVIQFYGRNQGNWVGSLKADLGDMLGSGDWAFRGLQLANNYSGYPSRRGWARLWLGPDAVYGSDHRLHISITRSDGSTKHRAMAFLSDISNVVGSHSHTEYAPANHNHDGRYYTKWEVDSLLSGKVNKGGGWHTHDINKASDGHAHGGATKSSSVG